MTNSSPPDPQNPIPERRTRPAAGVTFDEMIAIIVAFTTIGAILLWSLGGRRNRIASDLGIFNNSGAIGSGTSLFGNIDSDYPSGTLRDREIELEFEDEDELEVELPNQTPIAILPQRELERSAYRLDPGVRLAPFTGVAIPGLRPNLNNRPAIVVPDEIEVETEPEAVVPEEPVETEPEAIVAEPEAEPEAALPEETVMPEDVTPDYWAYPFVKQIREQTLIPEIARNQNFEPDTLITRASMATLIAQAFDMRPPTADIKTFRDVTERNAIAEDIDKAVRLGFMKGYSAQEFRPLENIPRYQVLVTLATGLGLEPSQDVGQIFQQFGDSDGVPSWARQQVAAAIENGLLVNRPEFASNSLMPETPATRAEVAAMIHQALVQTDEIQPLESEYIIKP